MAQPLKNPYTTDTVNDIQKTRTFSKEKNSSAQRVSFGKPAGAQGFLGQLGRLKTSVKIGLVLIFVSLALAGGYAVFQKGKGTSLLLSLTEANTSDTSQVETETPETISVHIDGAVVNPGVYDLEKPVEGNVRVKDAVSAAGGLTPEADVSSLNLAAKVEDGEKIHIPKAGEVLADALAGQSSEGASAGSGSASSAAGSSGTARSGLININTASEADLETLPGIGQSTAQAIIEDRRQNGAFSSIEDLMRVSGIGEKKFAKIKGKICV